MMPQITLGEAKAAQEEIDQLTTQLNSAISAAAQTGLVIEVETDTVRQLSASAPTPFVNVTVKIRPSDIKTES